MSSVPRTLAKLAAVLATAGSVLPAAAGASSSGGAGASGGTEYGAPSPGSQYGTEVADTGTPALHARPVGLLGRTMHFRGTAAPGQQVVIQRLDQHGGGWLTATTTQADANGDYVARWRADHIGVFSVRAVPEQGGQAHASQATGSLQVTVYKPALATWYGPGFYGKRTACGQRLTEDMLGVAHRGLPCGRKVAIYYRGRTLTVPVIDRGPYGDTGAAWDLTSATARALGFSSTDQVGAVTVG